MKRTKIGRRAFLVLGAGAIGGCVQGGTPSGGGTGQSTATRSESSPPTARSRTEATVTDQSGTDSETAVRSDVSVGIDSERSEPQTTETIGDADIPLDDETDTIAVWNNAETARHITITVERKKSSDEQLFQEIYRFKPDAYVVIGVSKPGEYTVSIIVDGGKPTSTGFKTDDCNVQSLYVTVAPDGAVRATGTSTMAKCGII